MTSDKKMGLVMLPGLDGTGRLFEPLIRELPGWISPTVISYPTNQALSYEELTSYVAERLPEEVPLVILAESFSGPIALELAASDLPALRGLVLCCTFCRSPRSTLTKILRVLPLTVLLCLPLPKPLLKAILLGRDASVEMTDELVQAIKSVSPRVLAYRIREVFKADKGHTLKDIKVPVCLISASQDRVVGREAADEMAQTLPDSESHVLNGTHLLLQTRPVLAVDAIVEFMKNIRNNA